MEHRQAGKVPEFCSKSEYVSENGLYDVMREQKYSVQQTGKAQTYCSKIPII